jgi:hypothetical protein
VQVVRCESEEDVIPVRLQPGLAHGGALYRSIQYCARVRSTAFAVSLQAPTALKPEEHEGHEGHEGRHAPHISPTAAFGRRSERPPRSKSQAPHFRLGVCGFDLEGRSAAERGRRDVRRAPASVLALFFVSFVNFVSFVCGCRDCGGGWIFGCSRALRTASPALPLNSILKRGRGRPEPGFQVAAKEGAMRKVTAFLKTTATILLRMAKRLARPGAGPKFVVS